MSQRVDLPYTAPVYVTVNIDTGHIERVYLDDESVAFDKTQPVVCVDTNTLVPVDDADLIARALEIADTVDWTSTKNRCAVWRGAEGGPENLLDITRTCLEVFLGLGIAPFTNARGNTIDESSIRAALRLMEDNQVWKDEHAWQ